MNWELGTFIVALVTLLVVIAGFIFVAGEIKQEVKETRRRTDANEALLKEHGERIGGHDVELERLKAWNEGAEAAAKWNAREAR